MKILAAIALCVLLTNTAHAALCVEKVKQVTVHSNGNVYFMTDVSCDANWCQLNYADIKQVDRGYSMLLTAKSTGNSIAFDWPSLSACGSAVPVYTSPSYMSIM